MPITALQHLLSLQQPTKRSVIIRCVKSLHRLVTLHKMPITTVQDLFDWSHSRLRGLASREMHCKQIRSGTDQTRTSESPFDHKMGAF